MKLRYYILFGFYFFCFVTYHLGNEIKNHFYVYQHSETLFETYRRVFTGFFYTVYILFFIWLVIAFFGYMFYKNRYRSSIETNLKLNEYSKGFKMAIYSVIITVVVFSAVVVLGI